MPSNAQSPTPMLLTVDEAAKLLSISPRTLFNLRNELPPVKIGASVRYCPIDLARFVEARKAR